MNHPVSPTGSHGSYQSCWEYSTPSLALSPTSTVDYSSDGASYDTVTKSGTDQIRERGAGIRALALLDSTLQPDYKKPASPHAKTARQAAIENHEAYTKEKRETKRIVRELKNNNPPPGVTKRIIAEKPLEKMATTTRKVDKRVNSEESAETVAELKCQLERDTEQWATKRALKMVDSFASKGFHII
jgi:hypothetical protein